MKNILFLCMVVLFFSCSNRTQNASGMDSMNAIDNNGIQDTTVSPRPNGYAPPNAETDTNENQKDSAN